MPQAVARRGHIGRASGAFVVVEPWCFRTRASGLTAKWQIVREAIRGYRANPIDRIGTTATPELLELCSSHSLVFSWLLCGFA